MAMEPQRLLSDEEAQEVMRLHHADLARQAKVEEAARMLEAEAKGRTEGRARLAESLDLTPEEFEIASQDLADLKTTKAWHGRERWLSGLRRATVTGWSIVGLSLLVVAWIIFLKPKPPAPIAVMVPPPRVLPPSERDEIVVMPDISSQIPGGWSLEVLDVKGETATILRGTGPAVPQRDVRLKVVPFLRRTFRAPFQTGVWPSFGYISQPLFLLKGPNEVAIEITWGELRSEELA